MIQNIAITFIGLLVAVWLVRKLYRLIFINKGKPDKCIGCNGCALIDQLGNPPLRCPDDGQ